MNSPLHALIPRKNIIIKKLIRNNQMIIYIYVPWKFKVGQLIERERFNTSQISFIIIGFKALSTFPNIIT